MSVSGLSSSGGANPADYQSTRMKMQADMRSLSKALQSGSLSDAQQAFATLQQDLPPKAQAAAGNSDEHTPLGALSTALQSGNLSDAQQAFARLQQVRHGHHHHGGGGASAPSLPAGADDATTSDDSGSQLNAVA